MEKENSASGGGGGGGGGGGAEAAVTPGATSTSEKLQADQANPLLDPTALFGAYWPRGDSAASSLFGGMPGGYGLGAPHLPSAYAILGRGGSAPGFGGHTPASAPPPSPYPHSSLGTLSVAASQAASLGINPAASAWWTMASHLAAQDYLARLQGAAGLPGFPPGAESLLPPYPASLLNPPSLSSHKSSKSKSSKSHKTPASSSSSTTPSMTSSSLPVSTQPPVTSHHSTPVSSTPNSQSNVVSSAKEGSDPSSILGGVRLPPDTEIIKYTSSIVGPKIPGTTNRGRKKTISLDTPSVSVHPPPVPTLSAHQTNTTSTASLMMEPRKYNRTTDSNEYRDSVDRVEVIKLPAHSTNGSVLSAPPIYTSSSSSSSSNVNNNINDSDAPLNLSLKPATTSSSSPISGSQPLSQLSNLSQSLLASDRTSRRKPGPKPRRVPQNSVPVPASPSPSLAQLFAAADSPQRPSSGSEESESASTTTHHKDGRPRNLGRGVSKPKKNTVASLLAQSRALGIKPTPTLDPSVPLSHQVSLLRSNILAAQLQVATSQSDDKYYHLLTKIQKKKRPRPIRASWARSHKSLQEKMKNKLLEASGEESNMDVTSESGSNTDVVTDTDDDNAEGTPSAKRRKLKPSERDLQIPLERGWKRETVIKGLGKTGVIKGDVLYYSPCGKTFRSSPDLVKFLEHQNPAELTTAHFSFSSRPLVGEFLQPTMGLADAEFVRLGAQEVARRLEELRAVGGFRDARTNNQYERDKLAYAKKLAKEEAQRHKEQARLIKEQEKSERLEAVRREREIRNQQLLEERELKRQQAVMLKEQERERRRQHMALVRALENRRKMEEKEKKRLEARAERIATKEKRAEQRRVEMELIEQIRKPVEDMELTDHRPLPEVKRIPGLKLSGQAFADIVMVFEFLHNFGETLGFDMDSLPSLRSLQLALLNDEEAEEEMLSVMTHLLVCAIEDPGIPQPARHTTGLGQSLRQADITHANISEVLRIYLYANATGEVKALTGVCLERERDKKFADHHQNGGDYASTCSGKNAQFYEHLHNNETWKMSERLRDKPFLALNPTHKAQMLAFLCNELLQNKAVIRQIEGSLETVAQLRKERFVLDTKIRKLRQLHSRKVRMEAVGVIVNKIGDTITIEKKEGEEESNTTSTAVGTTPTPDEIHHEDEVEDMSENESEGTQPEEEEDKNLSGEELGKKLDKLLKQSEEQLQKLNSSSKQLRAHIFGQDRYWRRYWELACSGGIFVEAMESAEPEVLELQAELDEKYKNMPIEEKSEVKQEGESKTNSENRENEAPNEVKDEKKHNSSEQHEDTKSRGDKVKSEIEGVNCKKEPVQNCGSENSESVKEEKKNNDIDSTMADAKTNVTSEEIKQETEVISKDVDMKEEVKKENEEMDEDTPKPLVKMMEDKIVETIPNGDKFNHVNNLHNGKELNGSFISIMSIISDNSNAEPNWFSILPRETCDTPGPSTKQIFGIAEPTELRIPIFPPPASPSYDRCDSPAPLILTQDEAVQLEYLKVHGLPPPGEAKPVPRDLRYGWSRITDVDTFQELLEHLHSRGVREKELKRTTWATMESFLAVTGRINVDPGNMAATELQAEPDDPNTPIPMPDDPSIWSEQVALRVDAQLLEQVEALEDKVANASMQVKGWKLPPRAGTEEAEEIEKLNEMEKINAVEQARQRLLSLEAAIERRYLKPPLGVCTGDPNLAALKAEQAAAANANLNNSEQNNQAPAPPEETTPRGLNTWREATARAHTSAQLAMALYMLEASIAWDKSIMKAVSLTTARNSVCAKLRNRCVSLKATNQYKQLLTTSQTSNCQFCHSGDNEDKLLLCDGCDRGYHTYCFRPKMENIPDGDWYCHECMNKATGERNCLVCGKRVGKNLVLCELCPRAYHTDCHNPVMPKMPRGKWYCSNCHSKQPKKRNSSRRSHTKGGGTRESESSDHPPASPTPSTASNTHVEDVSSSEPPTPTASPRKEGNNRTLTKKQQRELAPCKILLEQLEQQDEAWPFLLPVNTKQFPTYKKIIKTPMDLSTIKKKLQDSAYKSRDEFCADVRQMFINCEVFNEDDSPVGKAGHGMRSFFEMRWTEITGAPPPHPQTHS
ncbi:bromodomain adjacent to zinc finger domain protein 2B isoform X14 [Solenopsis invicta]|uniref:bromodomain adjacent to zinc finger domain protein 2B isoform X14 n=1 Tax=Solenopsis invicta TaxID=13686 RepID=UPI00193D24CA|nr:bromodomain adjacent to zinc finger domain protein 2B isoform X14 [Solenopsis invicta]